MQRFISSHLAGGGGGDQVHHGRPDHGDAFSTTAFNYGVVEGLSNGQSYTFAVIAQNVAGSSRPTTSNAVTQRFGVTARQLTDMTVEKLARFEENRPRLFSLAYQMLGEAAEAEDVVQDAYLRWERSHTVAVPEAWLTTVVANMCLSRLTSARARRERYVGSWLPEPVLSATGPGPLETVVQRDSLSFGMLLLLERLTPPQRLVFVLREAFDYSHREIAEILHVDEVHARQLYHRAQVQVGDRRKRFTPRPEQGRKMVERFLAAAVNGDVSGLERLLADDVVAWFDGGGRVGTARRPVTGRNRVARYLIAWVGDPAAASMNITIGAVNGEPAILASQAGTLVCVIFPELVDGHIVTVCTIANPDKLAFAAAQLA
jgi:RNA polymerase sigma factor (sigma-70 family)